VLLELLYPLRDNAEWLGWLNVLRYVPFRVVAALLTAMLICFALSPWFIKRLQAQQIGQTVRADGPQSHFSKAGTPTMGGSLILFALVIPTVLWANISNPFIWVALLVTVSYGLIGFYDDYRKVKHHDSKGLPAKWKFALQALVALGVCLYLFYGGSEHAGLPTEWLDPTDTTAAATNDLVRETPLRLRFALPFVSFEKLPMALPAWAYVIFGAFVIVAFSNAVNLTDGLDGLAIGPVMMNMVAYVVLAWIGSTLLFGVYLSDYLDIPRVVPAGELAVFCAATIGAGFGFLWYNTFPAQVFMGDVGSLALGGAIGTVAVLTKNEVLAVIIGGIFVLEATSVVTQVVSFKLTGKRIFRMAPIHHHFELKGWPEPRVIVRFWIISIMLALIAFVQLKLR
jgi:phospho-N-acetylmuramoyl-pentapeptide-transferase